MTAPRKHTSLLAWLPAQGTPGQRHANRALVRAFADAAAEPGNRLGKVRAVLAKIASEAEAAYQARIAESADAPESAPTPKAAPKAHKAHKAAKAAPKATPKARAKSRPQQAVYVCEVCARPVIATMQAYHLTTPGHKANAAKAAHK